MSVLCTDGSDLRVGCSVDQNDDGTATIRCADGSTAHVGEPAEPPPLDEVTIVQGTVTNLAGTPLEGVAVTGDGLETLTDAAGSYALEIPATELIRLRFSASGHLSSIRSTEVIDGAPTMVHVSLMPAAPPQRFDTARGGRVESARGAAVVLPADGVVDSNGQPVAGEADISITPVDPSDGDELANLPGSMIAIRPDGGQGLLESFGMLSVEITRNGEELQLGEGQTAIIEIPVPATPLDGEEYPAQMTLWHLNEQTNEWEDQGVATLDAERGVYMAEVSHFSFWNIDRVLSVACIRGRVVDRFNRPVRGAQIQSRGVDYRGQARVASGEDGVFHLAVRLNGQARVHAQHERNNNGPGQIVRGGPNVAPLPIDPGRNNCIPMGEVRVIRAANAPVRPPNPEDEVVRNICDDQRLMQIGRNVDGVIERDSPMAAPSCVPGCGNGLQDPMEECDDGNNVDGDGCSADCSIEGPAALCGDGNVGMGEECDDGNRIGGDGCSAFCRDEAAQPAGQPPTRGFVLGVTVLRSGPVCFTSAGSQPDTVLSVRQGRCGDANEIACNDDWLGLDSMLQTDLEEGEIYYLVVTSRNGAGPVRIRSRYGACPEPGDVCPEDGVCDDNDACLAGRCYDF